MKIYHFYRIKKLNSKIKIKSIIYIDFFIELVYYIENYIRYLSN